MEKKTRTAVVALGGNAISNPEVEDTIANRFAHTRQSLAGIIKLIEEEYNLAITHGNGPQVGDALMRVELAYPKVPMIPLGVLVADTQGSMGYMIEQSLQNALKLAGIEREVVTIMTQVLVDRKDPSLKNPTKFIGQFFPQDEAKSLAKEHGWIVKDAGIKGWRRVVGSPYPISIINSEAIKRLVNAGLLVIASGGGGIPVYREDDGRLEGVDAVIDKDRAAAILGRDIGAQELIILTNIEKVYIDFGLLTQKPLDKMTLSEAKNYLKQGQFPPGSMGPKIEAAISFLENGGEKVIIAPLEKELKALRGEAGTWVVPD